MDIVASAALLLLPLSGSLTGQDRAGAVTATATGALRYLPARGARTNLVRNPRFGLGVGTGWVVAGTPTVDYAVTDPDLGTCAEIEASAAAHGIRTATSGVTAGIGQIRAKVAHTFSFDVKYVAGDADWQMDVAEFTAAGAIIGTSPTIASFTATATVQRIVASYTPTQTGCHFVSIGIRRASATLGRVRMSNAVVEEGAIATPAALDGSLPGAAWLDPLTGVLGTAHNSPSVSAAAALVEEATTNLIANPSVEVNTANLVAVLGATVTRDTTVAYLGSAAVKAVTPGAGLNEGFQTNSPSSLGIAGGGTYRGSLWVRGSGTVRLQLEATYTDLTTGASGSTVVVLSDAWQRVVSPSFASNAAKTISRLRLYLVTANLVQATTFWADCAQIEAKAYATTYADGSLGGGYAWTGTAHASSSTRAAARLALAEAGRIDPDRGAVAVWFRRDTDAGASQRVVDVGEAGVAGKDALSLSVAADDAATATWTNGASGTTTATAGAAAVGAWVFAVVEWDETTLWLSRDGGEPVAQARPYQGDLTSATVDLGFGGTSAGAAPLDGLVGPVMICDRPLTAAERTTLYALTTPWAWDTIAAETVSLAVTEAAQVVIGTRSVDVVDAGSLAVAEAAVVVEVIVPAVPIAASDNPAIGGIEAVALVASVVATDTDAVTAAAQTQITAIPAVLPIATSDGGVLMSAAQAGVAAAVTPIDPGLLQALETVEVAFPPFELAAGDVGALAAVEVVALTRWFLAADGGDLAATTTATVTARSALPAPVVWLDRDVGADPAAGGLVWKDRV